MSEEGKYLVHARQWKGCPFCGALPDVKGRAASESEDSPTGEIWFASCYCGGYAATAWKDGFSEQECRRKWNQRIPLGAISRVPRITELVEKAAATVPAMGSMTATLSPIQMGWVIGTLWKEYQDGGWGCNNCHKCLEGHTTPDGFPITATRMVLCPTCGNKRCPKATDCELECTDSNEPGQAGSIYA